ncbi:uncharacterized protein LOC130497145 [Raphanus sativus]|uniref:Uncharacterized protein LOC130497145 n=1 Tax=Raphanus sativus TaxID=3726 RepID=A0A9W3C3R6_RAPSA|nr:uncharacterized protein LOC130497145 [Raphanus sativus]
MESSVAGPSATSVVTPTLGSDVALAPDPAVPALGPDVTPVPSSTIPASGPDVPLPAGEIVVPEQASDVQARPEGSLLAPIVHFEEMGACTATELAGPSSSGALVPSSEIPEVQDAGIVADKGGEEVGEGDGEAVPTSGESENEGGVPEDA